MKVKVLNPDGYLRPEMNASVAFYSPDKPHDANASEPAAKPMVTVPASAVRDSAVFVVVGGKALRRTVKVSGSNSQGVQVAEGLIGGEDLIVNPPADLKEGQKVRPKQA